MTIAILTILAALVPFGIRLWLRRMDRANSDEAKRNEIAKTIAGNKDVNALLDEELRKPTAPTDDKFRE